jgi:hypothetical protein
MGKDGGRGVYTCSSCGYIGGEKKDDEEKTAALEQKLAMAVTKKDFIAISDILKQNGADPGLAQQIANYFASQNQNFDNDRFMDASGAGQLPASLARALSRVAADISTGDSYWSETLDLGSSSGEDGVQSTGSPKIDKGKADGLKAIDVPSKRHENDSQDVADRAKYDKADFDPQNAVTDRINPDTPLQSEHNVADGTKTWTGTEGLANPVTSALSKWTVIA